MLVFVPSCFPARCFLTGPGRLKSLGVRLELRLGGLWPPSHRAVNQSQVRFTVWGPVVAISLDPFKEHLAGERFPTEADTKQLLSPLVTDTWHWFLVCKYTSFGATVGELLKYKFWLHGSLMCTIVTTYCTWIIRVILNPVSEVVPVFSTTFNIQKFYMLFTAWIV